MIACVGHRLRSGRRENSECAPDRSSKKGIARKSLARCFCSKSPLVMTPPVYGSLAYAGFILLVIKKRKGTCGDPWQPFGEAWLKGRHPRMWKGTKKVCSKAKMLGLLSMHINSSFTKREKKKNDERFQFFFCYDGTSAKPQHHSVFHALAHRTAQQDMRSTLRLVVTTTTHHTPFWERLFGRSGGILHVLANRWRNRKTWTTTEFATLHNQPVRHAVQRQHYNTTFTIRNVHTHGTRE